MRRLPILAAAAALLLAGCSAAPAEESLLAAHDLTGMTGEQVVDHLDRLGGADRPADLMASVRVDELQLSGAEQELALDLPEDRFYLSVAPYVNQTHDCYFHSLTTCQGELAGEDVEVTIVDDAGDRPRRRAADHLRQRLHRVLAAPRHRRHDPGLRRRAGPGRAPSPRGPTAPPA